MSMKARNVWILVVISSALSAFAETTADVGIMMSEYSVLRGLYVGAMVAAMGFAIIGIIVSFYDN